MSRKMSRIVKNIQPSKYLILMLNSHAGAPTMVVLDKVEDVGWSL